MCGRYALRNAPEGSTHTPWQDYIQDIAWFVPRYNIAPSEAAPVIYHFEGQTRCDLMHWGFKCCLIPLTASTSFWAWWLAPMLQTDKDIGQMLIPFEYPALAHFPVSNYVKKPGNEGAACLKS